MYTFHHISSNIHTIYNTSLSSGILPYRLKFSEIQHLHKKRDRMRITNFRQISLLTSFSKILEKVIYTRSYQHVNQNNILATEQYGFSSNSSTEKTSFKLINEVLLTLNNKLTVGGIFCDLEKPFDSINHTTYIHTYIHIHIHSQIHHPHKSDCMLNSS